MSRRFERILERWGQCITLSAGGEEQEVRAFLQPLWKKSVSPPLAATPLGAVSEKRWLYLGSPARQLRPGDTVRWGILSLIAQEAHPVCLGEQAVCCRAILRQKKEETI